MILNSYLSEAKILIRSFTEWVILLLVFVVFFFSFGLRDIMIFGTSVTLLVPSDVSFATQFFNYMTTDLIPEGVTLIVTNPLAAFIKEDRGQDHRPDR